MSTATLVNALALPPDSRVDRRVPKKLLLEQGAPTAADKRYLQDGIEEMSWIAALKPNNIGVPIFRDDAREYLEIAVLTAVLRAAAKPTRITELIHRAIPYPVVLVAEHGGNVSLSLAHKRWSQGETGKVVIEEVRRTAPFQPDAPTAEEASFLASLALASQPVRALPGLDRPRVRAGGRPDYRRVRRTRFARPLDGAARRLGGPRPPPARPDRPPGQGREGKAAQPPG